MAPSEYARWRDSPDCGWMTGTAFTGPDVCGRAAKFTTDATSAVNGRVCGIHARAADRRGATVEPIKEP